jgi:hypothetical protein
MSRELTYEKDTLPALSGLAAKLAVIHGSEYIAGLWKDNILLYLFWRLASFRRRWKQQFHQAPTFPWASVKVKSQSSNVKFLASAGGLVRGSADVVIHETRVTPSSSDMFGSVRQVTLSLPLL